MIYSAFKALVADHINRSDLTTQIGTFATLAIQKLAREQLYFLQTNGTLTTAASTTYVALPTDFVQEAKIGPRDSNQSAVMDANGKWLERTAVDDLLEYQVASAGTGLPTRYCIANNRVEFYPIPDAIYNLKLYYFKLLGAPADGAENAWTTTAYDVLFFATLSEAWDFLGNTNELLKAEQKKEKLLNKLKSISGKLLGSGQVKYNEV